MAKVLVLEITRYGEYYQSRYDILQSYGATLYFLTCSPRTEFADPERVRVCGSKDLREIVRAAKAWHGEECFDGVLTMAETSVIATAAVAEALGLEGVGLETARRSRNKLLMREAHARHGAPHPRFQLADDLELALAAAKRIGYPMILKPTLGAASQFVFRINGEGDLRNIYPIARRGVETMRQVASEAESTDRGVNSLLLESFLDGRECLVEVAVWDGDMAMGSIVDRVTIEGNTFDDDVIAAPTSLDPSQINALESAIKRGIVSQGIRRGVVHAEVRFHRNHPNILEIAVRPGGGGLDRIARICYGYCPLKAMLDICLGKPPNLRGIGLTGEHAAGMVLLSDEGRIDEITIVEASRDDDSVFFFKLMKRPGDIVRRPPYGNDILGFLCARGPSALAAMGNTKRAAGKIVVRVVPIEAV
jgi:biotin carboxylase